MSLIAEMMVGPCALITEEDIKKKKERSVQPNRDYLNMYNDVLDNPIADFLDYRFVCSATKYIHADRAKEHGCQFLTTSSQIVKLWLDKRNNSHHNNDFRSERQYFEVKRIALKETVNYIKKEIEDYPFDTSAYNDHYEQYEEFDGECPFVGGDDDVDRGLPKSYLRQAFAKLTLSCFEYTMSCPFSKEYGDFGTLVCSCVPDKQCKNKRFPDYRSMMQYAKNTNCVYHDILYQYLKAFNKEYERAIFYPRMWDCTNIQNDSLLYFKSPSHYYDIKRQSLHEVIRFLRNIPDHYPFARYNYVKRKTPKQEIINIVNSLFNYGFESKLKCPFSNFYMSSLYKHDRCTYLRICPCRDKVYKDLKDLIRHSRESLCDNHRSLYEYLRYFQPIYNKKNKNLCNESETKNKSNSKTA